MEQFNQHHNACAELEPQSLFRKGHSAGSPVREKKHLRTPLLQDQPEPGGSRPLPHGSGSRNSHTQWCFEQRRLRSPLPRGDRAPLTGRGSGGQRRRPTDSPPSHRRLGSAATASPPFPSQDGKNSATPPGYEIGKGRGRRGTAGHGAEGTRDGLPAPPRRRSGASPSPGLPPPPPSPPGEEGDRREGDGEGGGALGPPPPGTKGPSISRAAEHNKGA